MWITLFYVCASAIFQSSAQELNGFDAQAVTEAPYANQASNWESTRPPVTLSIRDGRSQNLTGTATDNPDQPLFYSNQWQPILMPIGLGNGRNRNSNRNENAHSTDHQFLPTFLRRPDSEQNYTVATSYYPQSADEVEYPHVPYPFESIFYYPSEPDWNSLTVNVDNTQNASLDDVKPVASYPATTAPAESNTENQPARNHPTISEDTQPPEVYRYPPSFIPPTAFFNYPRQSSFPWHVKNEAVNVGRKQAPESPVSTGSAKSSDQETINEARTTENVNSSPERYQPLPFYRNNPVFVPPMSPAFFNSYPFLPYTRDGTVPPMVPYTRDGTVPPMMPYTRDGTVLPMMPYPIYNPNFIREQGSEVSDTVQDIPAQQEPAGVVPEHFGENVPSETSANAVPPEPLPLPVPGFPFGRFPPPFAPPLLPNLPVSANIPLQPFAAPQPRSLRKPAAVADAAAPPVLLPVPLEPNQNVLPQVEYLEPEPQEVIPEVIAEEVVPGEKLDTPKSPYEFGFQMNDGKGNDQHRKEVSDGSGVVTGSYGFRDIYGVYRLVNYIADKNGFRAFIKSNEPGVASSGSADVVVQAERPPPPAIAEGLAKIPEPEAVVIPDENPDLLIAGSSIEN